jgi:hypothetical protein
MAIDKSAGIDAAIDDAARAMTDAAPSDALRANVVRRIAVPASRTPAWRPLAAAAAAFAIVAASVVWQWAVRPGVSEVPRRSAAIDPVPEPSTQAGAPRAGAAAPVIPPETAPVAEASRSRGRIARQSPGPAGVPDAVDIDPLAIAPVSPEEIEVTAVTALPGIDIAPIAIRPLAIAQVAGDQVE